MPIDETKDRGEPGNTDQPKIFTHIAQLKDVE